MDLSKLTYTKQSSERTPTPPIVTSSEEEKGDTNIILPQKVSSSYRKDDGFLSTSLVFVLSGGEKKERDFLSELIRQREIHSLRVAFMSEKGQGLQPYQMNERWKIILRDGQFFIGGQLYHLNDMDKVFLLSDVDEFYDQLVKILSEDVKQLQGKWIISNPCFEIWLYYCYLNTPEKDLVNLISETVASRSKKLKALGPHLRSGGINPCLAFEHMMTGIENSRAHYAVDEHRIPILFATNMHEMAEDLMDIMNNNRNEYEEFLRRREERRNMMRKQMR